MKRSGSLVALFLTFVVPVARGAEEPLRPYAKNPYYWEYEGKPMVLIGGTDDHNLFQFPNVEQHLALLAECGGNYIRNTMSSRTPGNLWPFFRLSNGKYDLTRFDDAYWQRFETLLEQCKKRGIIVQIEVWDRFDFALEFWNDNAFNPKNNVTYTTEQSKLRHRYPNHPGTNENPFFRAVPELENLETVYRFQKAFVERMLQTSLKYPNVLYCMDNETSADEAWGAHWAKFIRDQAAKQGKRVHTTEMWDPWDLSDPMHRRTIDHPETYSFIDISQNNHKRGQTHWDNLQGVRRGIAKQPRPLTNVKIYGADTGRYGKTRDGLERFWRNLVGGAASARFHRPNSGLGLTPLAQEHLRSARQVLDRVSLPECSPHNDLLRDREPNEAYCSAQPGVQYVVYFPQGGEVGLDLSSVQGTLLGQWHVIGQSKWTQPERIDGGAVRKLQPPEKAMAVYVLKSANSAP